MREFRVALERVVLESRRYWERLLEFGVLILWILHRNARISPCLVGAVVQTLFLRAIPDDRDILGHAVAADKKDARICQDLLARLSINGIGNVSHFDDCQPGFDCFLKLYLMRNSSYQSSSTNHRDSFVSY